MILILIKAGSFFKLFEVLILSGVKFLIAPTLSFKLGFDFSETVVVTTIGGILGVIFFFFLSEIILRFFKRAWPKIKQSFSMQKSEPLPVPVIKKNTSSKKNFSRKNKFIVLTRRKYGLWGIAFLTPILLSIPLGTFLASKYYKNKKSVLLSLTLSVIGWSIVMSCIMAIIKVRPF